MNSEDLNKTVVSGFNRKMLIPVIAGLLVFVILIGFGVSYLQKVNEDTFLSAAQTELKNSFQKTLAEDAELQNAILELIKINNYIQQAWLDKDRDALLKHSQVIFNYLLNRHNITHFYFHDISKVNFLRVHNPTRYGDVIERSTLRIASETLKPFYGLEFGTFGAFVMRVVHPWFIEGELVGYIELGVEINLLIDKLAKAHNYDMGLVVHETYVDSIRDIAADMKGELHEHHHSHSHSHEEWIKVHATNKEISNLIDSHIVDHDLMENGGLYQSNLSGDKFHTSAFDLLDAENTHAGHVIYSMNLTSLESKKSYIFYTFFIITFLIAIFLIYIYFLYSNKLQLHLNEIYQNLEREVNRRKKSEAELENYSKQLEVTVDERTKELVDSNVELKHDIELREKAEQKLSASEAKYQTLFEKTPDAILIIDGNSFVDCNDATVEMLHYKNKEELLMAHPSELSPPLQPDGRESWEKAEEMIANAFKNGSHRFEWDHKRANGEVFPVEVLLTSIPVGDRNILYTVWHDITDRKKNEETIRHQAYYDALTDLPNRMLFNDRLQQSMSHSKRYNHFTAVLYMDLDQFKKINDSLGHTIGDGLLIEVAKSIKECLRDGDTAARFGGDEFVVLLPELDNDDSSYSLVEKVANKIREAIAKPYKVEQYELNTSTSIGISIFTEGSESHEDILRQADMAMYKAKQDGRNKTRFFLPSMQSEVLKKLTLEKELVDAFKNEELYLCYQPQTTNANKIIGVEALLRWKHPVRGNISPLEFIPAAEDIGLIIPVSKWVLNKAMSDMNKFFNGLKDSTSINLSVNLSPMQFQQEDFVQDIGQALLMNQFKPESLTLEITENIVIDNIEDTINKCKQLKEMGINISLDDFGTGYSSLGYLKQLPIDELKIDRSFVADIETDKNDAVLVETIISMAQHLELDIVAEGVETLEQKTFLETKDCHIYQGYYFSKPLTLTELQEFYQSKVSNY